MGERHKILFKIMLPVLIGLVAVVWLFGREFTLETFRSVNWDWRTFVGIGIALIAVFGRDFGMAWRFRALTDRDLRWSRAAGVTVLCEFTSAITPTSVGGSALSMIYLSREGISGGRSTMLTMVTLLLDQLFFCIVVPLIFIIIPSDELFGFGGTSGLQNGIEGIFWGAYGLMSVWAIVLALGIFIIPGGVRKCIVSIFNLKLLRRWREKAVSVGDGIVETSQLIRSKSAGWWLEGFAATTVSWMSRYLVVNALIWGFIASAPQLLVFGRQFVVWALLMFSPTPGGSGLSEWLFKEYYGDVITTGGAILIIALLWRVLTYYIYLLAGIIFLPSYLTKKKQ